MDPAVVIALIAAVIAPVVTYLVAARRMSGKIATSDASDLWKEAGAIRNDYRTRLAAANERHARLEKRVQELEDKNDRLLSENRQCQDKIAQLEAIIKTLKGNP